MDMFLHLREFEGCIEGYFEYCTDLFVEDTAARFAANYMWVLENLNRTNDLPVSKVDIVSPAEKHKLLLEWNATKAPYDSEIGITAMFERQVALTPDNTALVFDDGALTYHAFNQKINQLANYLLKLGIGPEERIGIYIERSANMVIAIYATLKVGAAYVPLDTNNPADRLQFIIDDSEIKILLTQSSLSAEFNPPGCRKIELDTGWNDIALESSENPPVKVSPNNLAYLIYTSGSTGKPKGVMIENHSVINFINWRQKAYVLKPSETVLLKTPITFDISVLELFWPLFYGAKLGVLAPGADKFPDQIIETVEKFNVTFMQFVPSMLNVFLEFVNEKTITKLDSLRFVSTIGEALPPDTVNKFNNIVYKTNKTRLINTYGPTETTVEVSYFECTSGQPLEIVPIGRPMDNTGFYIVDEHMNIQPVGVIGELLIAGDGMARGYFKRPELTAERFIDNPFDKSLGPKIYHSGDLARYLPNGDIDFLGRMDFQVKIRGYRIELGEIESLIRRHEDVADTAVVVKDFIGGEKAIIAYIVPKDGLPTDELTDKVFMLLRGQLPDYMIPATMLLLDQFPLLPNGKLNRKALPVPENIAKPATGIILPKSETEKEILEIWKDVLNTSSIGISDNFFNIGGNSILLIQVATKIQKKFNLDIEVVKLFEHPTISSFAAFLASKQENKQGTVESVTNGRAQRMKNIMSQQRDRRKF
jgi:amino acid adenylation domain-containing protein